MPSLTMPNVGEGVTEGTVTKWLKHEGDAVQIDEPVVEVETDKAVVEIPSPFEGRLTKILVAEDETVPIGEPLAEFEVSGVAEAPAELAAEPAPAAAAEPPALPASPASQTVEAVIDGAAAAAAAGPKRTRQYSPVVLRLAAEHGIDLDLVQGRGVGGRVRRKDVLTYLEHPAANTLPPPAEAGIVGAPPEAPVEAPAGAAAPSAPAKETEAGDGGDDVEDVERVPLSATRRSIARHMSQSHRTIPVAWMVVEADVTGLVRLRERARDEFQQAHGVNLTYMPFFVQAIVAALKQHPALNATYTDEGVDVHRRYHMGVAVAVEAGLVVPVLRDADRSSIAGLARELDELGRKARDRKLTLEEMRGATFTIDNTGAFGSLVSQPIVPMGQVAIIATEAIRRELRVDAEGAFAARSVMNLSISFDHRALDGAQAGLFLRSVREHLEAFRPDQPVY